MYLIHAHLTASSGAFLPGGAAAIVRGYARPEERVEYVSAHPEGFPQPVLGLYLLSGSQQEAERAAEAVCRRALSASPELRDFVLLACRAAAPRALREPSAER
ncbi:hypothetical protein [Streptomyces sp. NPDC089919]|uniref:hypothetical protein n=1 Tax=Streptomyces sp. NPDC089919 TaxID=3155188 RepID=UPI003448D9CB